MQEDIEDLLREREHSVQRLAYVEEQIKDRFRKNTPFNNINLDNVKLEKEGVRIHYREFVAQDALENKEIFYSYESLKLE